LVGTGTVLAGRYRLEHHIASGGMGDVWQGFDQVLGRTVAVKCLRAPFDEPGFEDRFLAEARAMATISHPGVVEVYDFGDDPATGTYLVMKHIDGESLAHALALHGRLSPTATMRLVAEAAEALHAAHENGVTHRDVKPGNLLLRPDGSAVLTDFGIARSAGARSDTLTGSVLGTAGYIAPERATGQAATPRSDIYSLGVVAYRCLAGQMPFVGESLVDLALRHTHDEPPPLPADVPASVRAVVERAMAKDPEARWPSAAVLAAEARRTMRALQRHTAVAPVPTRRHTAAIGDARPGGRSAARLLATGAALVLVAIVVTITVIVGRGGEPRTDSPLADPAATSPSADSGAAGPTASQAVTATTAGGLPAGPPAGTASPAVPTNLTATPIDANTIHLQWTDNSTDEDGFTVIDGGTSRNVAANTTSFEWTGLPAASWWCFKIRSYNASGVSQYFPAAELDWVCATSLNGVGPALPTGLQAKPISPDTIRLQWTDNSSDEVGFTITNAQTGRNVGANTTSYDWTGLASGTRWCFKIRSYRASGVSDWFPAETDWVCERTPAA